MTKNHINKAYEHELRLLRDRMLLIAGRVEKMVDNAIRALADHDTTLAHHIIMYDKNIDRDEMVIDRQCLELLARRQPLGEDLRFIVSVIKMVTYFERMGDLTVKISQKIIKLKERHSSTDGLVTMGKNVQAMLKETIQAFALKDWKKATQIISLDLTIDETYHHISRTYIEEMASPEKNMEPFFHLLSVAKWFERMGDHCANLAELIIFMVKGEDVRHKAKSDTHVLVMA